MEYIYAAMLLHKAGKKVDEAGIKKVTEAAGIKADDARIKALVAALDGVDIEEALKSAPVQAVAASPAAGSSDKPAEEKKEKKKKKKEEEKVSDEKAAEGLGSLFG
ncbi:50S ribosomal protein P1 [Candidatus Woesearchaeota archaeon]|nr:50S ribosomal protein P1 [Candidatus Woesearchaeota archaeon]